MLEEIGLTDIELCTESTSQFPLGWSGYLAMLKDHVLLQHFLAVARPEPAKPAVPEGHGVACGRAGTTPIQHAILPTCKDTGRESIYHLTENHNYNVPTHCLI